MTLYNSEGIVLESAAPEEGAKALPNVLGRSDWTKQLGAEARRTALDSFDIAAVAKRYAQHSRLQRL
jgi:hypothetical protein